MKEQKRPTDTGIDGKTRRPGEGAGGAGGVGGAGVGGVGGVGGVLEGLLVSNPKRAGCGAGGVGGGISLETPGWSRAIKCRPLLLLSRSLLLLSRSLFLLLETPRWSRAGGQGE
jgi:hypothetical protein